MLVELDGSESSDKTLRFALDLAEKYYAEILLLNVYQPITPLFHFPPMSISTTPIETPITTAALSKELKTRHENILAEALEKTQKIRPNLKVSTMLREGRPSENIIEVANEEKIDLIVLGSRGIGSIKESLLGNVRDRVTDEAKCSILIVK